MITAEYIHAHTITITEGEICPTGEHWVPNDGPRLWEGDNA